MSSSLFTLSTSLAQTHRLKIIYCKLLNVIGTTVLMDSFIPEIKMRSSAKSIPERKRGASIRTIRLRKKARMDDLLKRIDEVNDDTEGSVVDQGGEESEVTDLCGSDESVSTST